MEDHGGMYFSLFYAVVEPDALRVRYSTAGHPPAIVLGPRGELRRRLAIKNPPIGTMPGRTFAQAESTFEHGDRLYAFSDGAYEFMDREGRDRTLDEFERELVAHGASRDTGEPRRLYEASCKAAGSDLLADDFTLLLVEHASKGTH